ncbi:metallophosphoesterase [Rhodobacter sp. SY28-1]|uniref:metallophosphoesterase family protein n=1 Tax=Rhodobacter sp. SY28-1 TaxID=2562317 RepID=UPI00148599A5|nr:metallophosphoesterase [Rhodobacter sp. SY28-1]
MRRLTVALLVLVLAKPVTAESLRIAVISDLNGSYGSTDYGPEVSAAIDRIITLRPDLVISTGDMVAGQRLEPTLTPAELAGMWASFHATVSDPLARAGLPLLATPGNHDASAYPGFEAERTAFAEAWVDRVPDLSALDSDNWPFRGAWSVNGVLLVGIDATRSGPLPDEDMVWLRNLLALQAAQHRAVILFGHLPLMPISQGREGDVLADPALFDLAQGADVDLWLSGHHHAFYSGQAGGILFVAQAALGSGPRKLIGETAVSAQSFTWIEVSDDGAIAVAAYPSPGFETALDADTMPPTLGSGNFRLTRAFDLPD